MARAQIERGGSWRSRRRVWFVLAKFKLVKFSKLFRKGFFLSVSVFSFSQLFNPSKVRRELKGKKRNQVGRDKGNEMKEKKMKSEGEQDWGDCAKGTTVEFSTALAFRGNRP